MKLSLKRFGTSGSTLALLCAVAAVPAFASVLITKSDPDSTSKSSAPAHANWIRFEDQNQLLKASSVVVSGRILQIEDFTPLDEKVTGAKPGALVIPRRLVTLQLASKISRTNTEESGTFTLLEHLAPKGNYFPESRPLRVGQSLTVFARPAADASPSDGFAARQVHVPVGLDGLYLDQGDGRLTSPLNPTYGDAVATIARDPGRLRAAFQEADAAPLPTTPNPGIR